MIRVFNVETGEEIAAVTRASTPVKINSIHLSRMPESENTMGGWFIVATSDSPTCHLFAVQLEFDLGAFNVKQK
jgi:hypothetical protein